MLPYPQRKNVMKCKWIYKITTSYGVVERYNAHLIEKGFYQHEGINYMHKFSLVAKINPILIILFHIANVGWEVHHMDVKS